MNTFGLNGMVLKCQPDRQQSQTTSADVACMRVTEDDHPTSWRVRLMFFSLPYSFTKITAIFNSEHDSIKGWDLSTVNCVYIYKHINMDKPSNLKVPHFQTRPYLVLTRNRMTMTVPKNGVPLRRPLPRYIPLAPRWMDLVRCGTFGEEQKWEKRVNPSKIGCLTMVYHWKWLNTRISKNGCPIFFTDKVAAFTDGGSNKNQSKGARISKYIEGYQVRIKKYNSKFSTLQQI